MHARRNPRDPVCNPGAVHGSDWRGAYTEQRLRFPNPRSPLSSNRHEISRCEGTSARQAPTRLTFKGEGRKLSGLSEPGPNEAVPRGYKHEINRETQAFQG